MSHVPKVMHAFARLLKYPDQHTSQASELLYVVLKDEIPDAAREVAQFGAFLEAQEPWQVEEAFTGTFDVNPACALEVGWHLFGEEYARGMFLVRMREEMRKYNIPESAELPDHISHVLGVIAEMSEDKAAKFVTACVQPAIQKMNAALAKKDTAYKHVVSSLNTVITEIWGASQTAEPQSVLASQPSQLDPLHAFPVADVGCGGGCSGSCSEPVVTLETNLSPTNGPASDSPANSESDHD